MLFSSPTHHGQPHPGPKEARFLLPPGCKDLHDVLELQRCGDNSPPGAAKWATAFWSEELGLIEGPLADLDRHLRELSESAGPVDMLSLSLPDGSFDVCLQQVKGLPLTASLALEIGTEREWAMRGFCIRHKFSLPLRTPIPAVFRPNLPVFQLYRLSPLPADPSAVVNIVLALYREVAGLDETTRVLFSHR